MFSQTRAMPARFPGREAHCRRSGQSLYATFRPVFARIAQDEPSLEGAKLPSFGTLRTPWSRRSSSLYASGESVGDFYRAWLSFETSKEFEHEADEIPDSGDTRSAKRCVHFRLSSPCRRVLLNSSRRTRAKMKKFRAQARKEYNDAVRVSVKLRITTAMLCTRLLTRAMTPLPGHFIQSLVLRVRNLDPRYVCRNGCLCMGCFARHLAGMRR